MSFALNSAARVFCGQWRNWFLLAFSWALLICNPQKRPAGLPHKALQKLCGAILRLTGVFSCVVVSPLKVFNLNYRKDVDKS